MTISEQIIRIKADNRTPHEYDYGKQVTIIG